MKSNAGSTGSPVPLQNIAVNGNRAVPQLGHIHTGPEGTAHQAKWIGSR